MELTDKQKRDYEFVQKAVAIQPIGEHIQGIWIEKFQPEMDRVLDSGEKNIIWLNQEEVFRSKQHLNFVYNEIKKYPDRNIKIMCSTTSRFHLGVEPLINIYQWGNNHTRRDISWGSYTDFYTFDKDNFLSNNKKEIKGILSWRKGHLHRNYVWGNESIQNEFEGIKRYAHWTPNPDDETEKDYERANEFPTLYELIQEYNKSYVSFVFETESVGLMNQFSEKILLAFMSKTIPILHGGRGMIRELQEMGFKVWNYEFGFGDDDRLPDDSKKRHDSYINCIQTYNKMTFNEIKEMYERYRDDIEHNFKLASLLLNHGGFKQ